MPGRHAKRREKRHGELIEVEKNTLLARADVSAQILSELVKKGVMKIYKKEVNRFKLSVPGESKLPVLTKAQNEAYFAITDQMKQKPVVLLRGSLDVISRFQISTRSLSENRE